MYIKITYDQEFDDLLMYLKSKYPQKLFDLDGIGEQTDMNKFSKKFFSVNTTADASIDANANVDDISVIAYHSELPKPFFRLNSYYMLWKELRRLYSLEVANTTVEKQLVGDIYINDFHGIGGALPYSYHQNTVLCVKINENPYYITMFDLFDIFKNCVVDKGDFEEINFINLEYPIKIDYPKNTGNTKHLLEHFAFEKIKIYVLDNDNEWVRIQRVLRHKTDKKLLKIGTKNGMCTIVTTDHPVILEDGSEVLANNIKIGDRLKLSNSKLDFKEDLFLEDDFAYLIGFWLGDGWSNKTETKKTNGSLWIRQNNIVNHKIMPILYKYFNNVKIIGEDKVYFGAGQFYNYFCRELLMGEGASTKKLPTNILRWNKSAIVSLICGIIDSDGTVNKSNGNVSIRVSSFAMVQQISEILKSMGEYNTRTSFLPYKEYDSTKLIKTKKEMYRVSFRVFDDTFNYSEKIKNNFNICVSSKGLDGRYETNEVSFIEEYCNSVEYVYDITTDSGVFHSQGLIQHNCYNYSTYDILTKGLPMVKKIKSFPPKYLYSFKSQLEQFTVLASNSTLGACGLADMLIVISYFVKNILNTKSDANFKFKDEDDCWKYVKENLVSFVYTINQPRQTWGMQW